jgi:hypothetical protein
LLTDTAKDAFDQMLVLGWRSGLAAIVAGLATSFFLFGYAVIYLAQRRHGFHGGL